MNADLSRQGQWSPAKETQFGQALDPNLAVRPSASMLVAIAFVCHEANRAYCEGLGDHSQQPWDDAPGWQRNSAIEGVRFHILHPGLSPRGSHDNWLAHKLREGWKHGPVKDAAKKEHPCVLPWDELPEEQRRKDVLFCTIVSALTRPV